MNSSETEFTVSFEGQALSDHAMDVRDLAPALMALGQLFEHSNKLINEDRAKTKLRTVALSPGSFEIHFALQVGLIDGIVDILSGDHITAALNLRDLLFAIGGIGGVGGVVKLVKFLKGRVPKKEDVSENDDGTVTIYDNGKVIVITSQEAFKLYLDVNVRQEMHKSLSPLDEDGIEKFVIKSEGEIKSEIHDYEYEDFRYEEEFVDIVDVLEQSAFRIVSLTFREGNKWRLSTGDEGETISVSINDEEFLDRIQARETQFGDGDILVCDVRKRQYMEGPNLKVEYTVVKVHEHKHIPRQIEMNLPASPQDEDG